MNTQNKEAFEEFKKYNPFEVACWIVKDRAN